MASGTFQNWGPYLSFGHDSATEMRVAWKTEKYTKKQSVLYGLTEECKEKIEEDLPIAMLEHKFILKNLKPDSTYYYRISRDPEMVYTFKTGKPLGSTEPFEFTIMGDIHAYPANPIKKGFDTMLEVVPDHAFGITLGDTTNDGNDQTHWNALFDDAYEYMLQKPLMNATGNHDTDNEDKYARFLQAWAHPFINPKVGGYYLMEYANAIFFFVDSNNAGGWEPTPGDEQYEWLETNLAKYAKRDKWIFLFMHHQIFSTGDFSCAHVMTELYRNLAQEYHIDAIFYGHDHHYECFWVDRDFDYGGTLFVVSGASCGQNHVDYSIMGDRDGKTKYIWPGRFLNVRKHGVPPPSPKILGSARDFRDDKMVKECQLLGVLEPHFTHVRIEGDVMELRAIGWQKQVFHHLRLKRTGTGRKFDKNSELKIIDY